TRIPPHPRPCTLRYPQVDGWRGVPFGLGADVDAGVHQSANLFRLHTRLLRFLQNRALLPDRWVEQIVPVPGPEGERECAAHVLRAVEVGTRQGVFLCPGEQMAFEVWVARLPLFEWRGNSPADATNTPPQ